MRIQTLSTYEWCKKNDGAEAASIEHMVPPIKQWTLSWNWILNISSKSLKAFGLSFNSSATLLAVGGMPWKLLLRQLGLPSLTSGCHARRLKGPLCTHPCLPPPFPPNPPGPECHTPVNAVLQGFRSDQSQYETVTRQSTRRSMFSYCNINHRCHGRNWSRSWIPVLNNRLWLAMRAL